MTVKKSLSDQPVKKKRAKDSLKIIIGAVLIFNNVTRSNFGFIPFDGGKSFNYTLLMNALTVLTYALGIWLINSNFKIYKRSK
ncbi:hypothetical protein KKF32_04955 [Patescibacteria group bacterium]|nr:hypothetical protein [Patescibacteria group bacterium]